MGNDLVRRATAELEEIGLSRPVQIGLAGALGLLLLFGIYSVASGPAWVPAYSGLDLQTADEISQRLDEEGVSYRLEGGGSVLTVPEGELAKVKVMLAGEGLPASGRPGLELFDRSSWGMTDFTQRVNYRRALEGELERTIQKLQAVESSKVHLALHESSVFRSEERPSEASVVLELKPGMPSTPEMVRGVTYLVASSVDGLLSENVTVLNGSGRVLSASLEPGSLTGVNARQLEFQQEVEAYLASKAEEIVAEVVGRDNARIRVSARLNFDKVDRTIRALEPDEQVLLSEERAEIIPGDESQGAGSLQSRADYEATRRLEHVTGAGGSIERLAVAVLVNQAPGAPGPDGEGEAAGGPVPRTEAELDRIEALVRNAVGIEADRGDEITVVSVPFASRAAMIPTPEGGPDQVIRWIKELEQPLMTLFLLVMAGLVVFRVLGVLREEDEPADDEALPAGEGADAAGALPDDEGGGGAEALEDGERAGALDDDTADLLSEIAAGSSGVRDRVAATVMEEPDTAVQAIRAWMAES